MHIYNCKQKYIYWWANCRASSTLDELTVKTMSTIEDGYQYKKGVQTQKEVERVKHNRNSLSFLEISPM